MSISYSLSSIVLDRSWIEDFSLVYMFRTMELFGPHDFEI
jgi:hypothetical protein